MNVLATIIDVVAPLVLLVGLWFTARNYNLARRVHRLARDLGVQNFDLALSGQITDRYATAIELLGNSDSADVRIGGMFALERIARDSPPDEPTIVEVLSAFVRGHAPLEPDANYVEAPPADVLAALAVLRRRTWQPSESPVDLRETRLPHADLRSIKLPDALLSGAVLACDLSSADLSRATMVGTVLQGANLVGANLSDADMQRAFAPDARFDDARMMRVNLSGADLTRASLVRACLAEAFGSVDLRGADLRGAVLTPGVSLTGDFEAANLTGANLTGATLVRSNFDGAVLDNAILDGANLGGANVTTGSLSPKQLETADRVESINWVQPRNFGG